jgi:hypothetical protein
MIEKIRIEKNTVHFTVGQTNDYFFSLVLGEEEMYQTGFYCSPGIWYFITHPAVLNSDTKLVVNNTQKIKLVPKVYHIIPWKTETNKIGEYLNDVFKISDDEDWICFLDGDAIHTTTWFGKRIEETIMENLNFSMFSCLTNRTTPTCQIASESNWEDNDLSNHRKIGEEIWEKNKTKVKEVTNISPVSGYFFLVKKETWKKAGGFDESKMLGVEWDFCDRVVKSNGKIGVMLGIYVYHWYRGGNKFNNNHLK